MTVCLPLKAKQIVTMKWAKIAVAVLLSVRCALVAQDSSSWSIINNCTQRHILVWRANNMHGSDDSKLLRLVTFEKNILCLCGEYVRHLRNSQNHCIHHLTHSKISQYQTLYHNWSFINHTFQSNLFIS